MSTVLWLHHLIRHPFLAFFSTVLSFIMQPHSAAFGLKPKVESINSLSELQTRFQVLPTLPNLSPDKGVTFIP